MAVPCMSKTIRRPAAWFASASGMVTAGATAASRVATDLTRPARNSPHLYLKTRPKFRPGLFFDAGNIPGGQSQRSLARRADRTQHRFARPAVHFEPGRFLIGPEC